ncbi:hypothetical protein K438DRAFT_1987406 [Mycena galopus ATCC 62051]|nr:hypothetical protein K438DRAFT_1987406 [Mycena galopus ATCC 62051]
MPKSRTRLVRLLHNLPIVIPFTRSSPGPSSAKSLPSEAEPNVLRADYLPSPSSSSSSTRGIWESDNETAALDNIPFFFAYRYSDSANALPAPAEPAAATPMLELTFILPTTLSTNKLRRKTCDRLQPPQAHQPILILYSPYILTEYESLKDEVADCMNKFCEFKRVINTTVTLWATVGHNREAFLPEFAWQSHEEDRVYELRVPASRVFELGDTVHCHGLVTGDWRMTGPVERYSRRSKKQWHGLQDWVCIMCQNPLLQQEVLVKIPAEYFYLSPPSSSQASTFHRTLHKFKLMFNLSRISEEPVGRESIDMQYAAEDN